MLIHKNDVVVVGAAADRTGRMILPALFQIARGPSLRAGPLVCRVRFETGPYLQYNPGEESGYDHRGRL